MPLFFLGEGGRRILLICHTLYLSHVTYRERVLREWEDDLEIGEGKVGGIDKGLEKMMKELRIREN